MLPGFKKTKVGLKDRGRPQPTRGGWPQCPKTAKVREKRKRQTLTHPCCAPQPHRAPGRAQSRKRLSALRAAVGVDGNKTKPQSQRPWTHKHTLHMVVAGTLLPHCRVVRAEPSSSSGAGSIPPAPAVSYSGHGVLILIQGYLAGPVLPFGTAQLFQVSPEGLPPAGQSQGWTQNLSSWSWGKARGTHCHLEGWTAGQMLIAEPHPVLLKGSYRSQDSRGCCLLYKQD